MKRRKFVSAVRLAHWFMVIALGLTVAAIQPQLATPMSAVAQTIQPINRDWERVGGGNQRFSEIVFAPTNRSLVFARDFPTNDIWLSLDQAQNWAPMIADRRLGRLLGVTPEASPRLLVAGESDWLGHIMAVSPTGRASWLNLEPIRHAPPGAPGTPATVTKLFVHSRDGRLWFANIEATSAGQRRAAIFRSVDGGLSWRLWRDEARLLALDPTDPSIGYARRDEPATNVGPVSSAPLEKTTDGGQTWQELWGWGTSHAVAVHLDANLDRFIYVTRFNEAPGAATISGPMTVTFSQDQGDAWGTLAQLRPTKPTIGGEIWSLAVDPAKAAGFVIAQSPDLALFSPDQTRTWHDLKPPAPPVAAPVAPDAPFQVLFDPAGDHLYLITGHGAYRRPLNHNPAPLTLERCQADELRSSSAPVGPFSTVVSPTDSNRLYTQIGPDGSIVRSNDGGVSGEYVTTIPGAPRLLAVDPFDPNRLYFTGPAFGSAPTDSTSSAPPTYRSGVIYAWAGSLPLTPINPDPIALPRLDPNAVTPVTRLDISLRQPNLWLAQIGPTEPDVRQSTWFKSRDRGVTWSILIEQAEMVWEGGAPGTLFAKMAQPDYPSRAQPALAIAPLLIPTPAPSGAASPTPTETSSVGPSPTPTETRRTGRFLRTTDDGMTWQAIEPVAAMAVDTFTIDRVDPSRIYLTQRSIGPNVQAGWSQHRLYRSTDSGSSWRAISAYDLTPFTGLMTLRSPLLDARVIADPAFPGALLAANHLLELIWSPDGGDTWFPVKNFPLASPIDALFAFDLTGQRLDFTVGGLRYRCDVRRPPPYRNP